MKNYLTWLTEETQTKWWHDSAIPNEIDEAITNGALGVTTNPVLTYKSLQAAPEFWQSEVDLIPEGLEPVAHAEALLKIVAQYAAKKFEKIYDETDGIHGYAFGQVNPEFCGSTEKMLAQGLRYASWAKNIAVKLPTVQASLPVIEELSSLGIAVCTTLNFSVSQAIAAAEAYECGIAKAQAAGVKVKPCFVVQQGGRLDEYLMDCAMDNKIDISEKEIRCAGNYITKKVYNLFENRGYSAIIMPAGLRGVHNLTEMAGAHMVFSLQSRIQKMVNEANPLQIEHINDPLDPAIIEKLRHIPEFVRAFEEGGLKPAEFITFGVTQRTLSQFLWTGWSPLETYGVKITSSRWF